MKGNCFRWLWCKFRGVDNIKGGLSFAVLFFPFSGCMVSAVLEAWAAMVSFQAYSLCSKVSHGGSVQHFFQSSWQLIPVNFSLSASLMGLKKKKKTLDPVSSTTLGENGNCYKGIFLSQARGLGVLDMGGPEPRPSSAYRVRTLTELQHGQLLWSICFSVLQLQWPNTCQITHL